jgi:hypothetical protein
MHSHTRSHIHRLLRMMIAPTLMILTCSTGPKYVQMSCSAGTVTQGWRLPKYLVGWWGEGGGADY